MKALESFSLTYLLNSLWQVPLVFAAAWLAARAVRRSSIAMEHRIWVSALALAALLPACAFQPAEPFLKFWQLVRLWETGAAGGEIHVTMAPGVALEHGLLRLPSTLLAAIALVYGCSILYFAGRLAWGLWKTSELRSQAECAALTGEAGRTWERCSQIFAVHDAEAAVSGDIAGPITIGIFRRMFLLPTGWQASLLAEDLDAAIAHEFAHMRRRDFAKNLAYELLSLPIAYHPLLWLTRARITESREMVCDAMAADAVAGREKYARSLLRLASTLTQKAPARTLHAIGIFDANIFERRVMNLTQKRVELRGVRRIAIATACVALGLGTCASALALRIKVPAPQSEAPGVQERPMHVGGSVIPPKLVYHVDPVYSEEARQARFSGNVQVYLWVDKDGNPSHIRVVKAAGKGLDEKAVEAVRQYKFTPATLNGAPVAVDLYIDVNFQIFDKDKKD